MAIKHLVIDNGNFTVGVKNKTIKNLYTIVTNSEFIEEGSDLRGNITVINAHPSKVQYLTEHFENLNIEVTGDYYIENNDPATQNKLDSLSSDGIGLTITQANAKTDIGSAFLNCTTLTDASFLQYFTGNPNLYKTFKGCTSLQTVVFPNNLTTISGYTFDGCTSLSSITLPEGIIDIQNYAFNNCTGLTAITIPNTVESIGTYAFSNCILLSSIEIPDSVTTISSDAFNNTSWYDTQSAGVVYAGKVAYKYKGTLNADTDIILQAGTLSIAGGAFKSLGSHLKSVTIPNSVINIGAGAFSNNLGLTSITIPDSVTYIGSGAFSACTGLKTVSIGRGVISIPGNPFFQCLGLESITVDSNNTVYDSRNNCNALIETSTNSLISGSKNTIIPNTVTSIKDQAFYYVASGDMIIPNSVTSIGYGSFAQSPLQSITIPGSIKNIPGTKYTIAGSMQGPFQNCSSLKTLILEEGVERIEDGIDEVYSQTSHVYSAFGNSGLITLYIPSTLTYIGKETFRYCDKIAEIHIANVESWCNITFKNIYSNPIAVTSKSIRLYLGETEITNLIIPNTLTSIKDKAFSKCISFTSVDIPNSVTSIGSYAFQGCSSLTSVTIPNSVTSIGNSAFYGCSSLTSVTIGSSVTTIGNYAFNGCSNLTSVTAMMETPVSITSNVFSNRANATLYVPHGCAAAYQAADYWKEFMEIIELPEE